MNEQIISAKNIFDLFALFSSYILENLQKNSYVFYDFNDEKYNDVHDAVEKYVDDVESKGHKMAVGGLKKYLMNYFRDEINIEMCFAVVRYIDDMVDLDIWESLFRYKKIIQYNTVSKKYVRKVRIVPKMKNTLLLSDGEFLLKDPVESKRDLFRSSGECYCSALDEVMVNYSVWDKDKIKRFPMNIYRLNRDSALGRNYMKSKKLTIGVVPFTCKGIDDLLDIVFSQGTFSVIGMKEEAEEVLRKRYIDVYRRSFFKDIDFLIFPEMMMTEDIVRQLQEEETTEGCPKFIVNGSIWEDYTNRSILTDGEGNEIFTYYKKNPYIYIKDGKEYKECLKERSDIREYSVLEIDGIGRVGICICKDLMHEDILMFHKYLKTDLLLVPAFSNSLKAKTDARNMAEKYNCVTVFVNSCAAYKEHWKGNGQKDIGFLTVPAKEKTSNDSYIRTYCADACVQQCEEKCLGKLITLSYTDLSAYGTKFSININETIF